MNAITDITDAIMNLRSTHFDQRGDEAILKTESLCLPSDKTTPAWARRFVADTLARWGCDAAVESATLLVSELATNAVIHAHSSIEIQVHLGRDFVLVDVVDKEKSPARIQLHAAPWAMSGRGLSILNSLSSNWGMRLLAEGKSVWFELPRYPSSRSYSSSGGTSIKY